VPGRAGKVPASFGREAPEDFTIKEGQALHLVLHLDVRADPKSLEVLRAAVRDATRAAVLDGYAQAFEEMDTPDPPPAGDGPEPDAPAGG
jgi:hypothetical protein